MRSLLYVPLALSKVKGIVSASALGFWARVTRTASVSCASTTAMPHASSSASKERVHQIAISTARVKASDESEVGHAERSTLSVPPLKGHCDGHAIIFSVRLQSGLSQ